MLFKIVTFGASGGGRSVFFNYLAGKGYDDSAVSTVGVDIHKYNVQNHALQVWDCAGQEKLKPILLGHAKDAKAIIVSVDTEQEDAVPHARSWMQEAIAKAPDEACCFFLMTKCDASNPKKVITRDAVEALADAFNGRVSWVKEISSKDGFDAQTFLLELLRRVHKTPSAVAEAGIFVPSGVGSIQVGKEQEQEPRTKCTIA